MVKSHSLLRTPTAWSTRESKRAPCGNGNLPATVPNTVGNANVVPGATVTGRWDVTAGDGNGPVSITYVTTDAAAANFNGGAALTMNMPTIPRSGTGQYPFTFTAPPAGACQGGTNGKTCYIQFKSTSNWYSCMSMSMLEAPVPTPAPQPAVTNAPTTSPTDPLPASLCEAFPSTTTASICQGLIGRNTLRPYSATFSDKITEATNAFTFNRFNPLVFRNGASIECGNALAAYFCADVFPSCTPGSLVPTYMCQTRCDAAIAACDVDPYHASAFSCDIFTNTVSDSYGACPAAVTQRKIHLKSRYVGPTDEGGWAPGQKYLDMKLYAGDKLTFKWTGDNFVAQFATYADYQSCNPTGATQLPETSPGSKTVEWITPSFVDGSEGFFFGGSDCKADNEGGMEQSQRLKVVVVQAPAGATIVPLQGTGPDVIPAVSPTASPGGFIPGFEDEDSAVCANAMMFVLFLSALLNFVL